MIAQQSPFANQPPQQASGLAPQQQGGNFVQSSPMQKTIVAGMAPAIVGGQMVGMPQNNPNLMQPQGTREGSRSKQGYHRSNNKVPGPNKT